MILQNNNGCCSETQHPDTLIHSFSKVGGERLLMIPPAILLNRELACDVGAKDEVGPNYHKNVNIYSFSLLRDCVNGIAIAG